MTVKDAILKDVFISYSSADTALIERVVQRMRGDGLEVWYAPADIKGGDQFIRKIEEGLQKSQVVVTFFSPAALDSYWVEKEWSARLLQMSRDKTLRLIPVLLSGINDQQLPLTMQTLNRLDFRQADLTSPPDFENQVSQLIQQVKGELPRQGTETLGLPFVVFTMTKDEAGDLVSRKIFNHPDAKNSDKQLFDHLIKEVDYPDNLIPTFYAETRDAWQPPLLNPLGALPAITIRDNIEIVIGRLNDDRATPSEPLMRAQFFSTDFLADDDDWRQRTWVHLKRQGCVLVIDVFSLCHPVLRGLLEASGFGATQRHDNISMVVIPPVRCGDPPFSRTMEKEIGRRLELAFRRYNVDYDLLCDFGVWNGRDLNRWLYWTLPETARAVQQMKPNSALRQALRDQQGKQTTGIEKLWSRE